MFPGPKHQMDASLNLVVTKILVFIFLSHADFAVCYLDLCYPNLDSCSKLYPQQKKEQEKLARSQ